jgi:hypothetical protein
MLKVPVLKRALPWNKTDSPPPKKQKLTSSMVPLKSVIQIKIDQDGTWMPGIVRKSRGDGTFMVEFADGVIEKFEFFEEGWKLHQSWTPEFDQRVKFYWNGPKKSKRPPGWYQVGTK